MNSEYQTPHPDPPSCCKLEYTVHDVNKVIYEAASITLKLKVSKKANVRNRYDQEPHLTQDTTWESDKTQENISYKRASSR